MEIIEKIKNQIEAGFTRTEIYENLEKDGYSESEINDSLRNAEKTNKIKKYKVNKYVLTMGIAAVIFFFGRALGDLNYINRRETISGQDTTNSYSMIILFSVLGGISLIGVVIYSLRKK